MKGDGRLPIRLRTLFGRTVVLLCWLAYLQMPLYAGTSGEGSVAKNRLDTYVQEFRVEQLAASLQMMLPGPERDYFEGVLANRTGHVDESIRLLNNALPKIRASHRDRAAVERENRIAAIAKEYVKSPEGTLVVSPDNRSRVEINERIRAEMQERSLVSKDGHRIHALVPRQDLTGPERTWAARYEFNDVVRYARTSKETGMERGEYARVKSVDAEKNLLTVVRADGSELTYDPRRQQGVSVYREEPRSFAVGDRIQFTAPANDLKIANRQLGTVEAIGQDRRLSLKLD
jgi:hypothetical protein